MKKKITFQDGTTRDFELSRIGFIQAVSYKESSADLKRPLNDNVNLIAAAATSSGGHRGFFQMGESALFETGYYLGDTGIDFRKLDPKREKSLIGKVSVTFNRNDWKGSWAGKNNIFSLNDFVSKPELQLKAVSDWINYLCKRMRLLNFNQYYGKIINGVEVTESGAIASAHLMGEGGLATFLNCPVFNQKYPVTDGNGTHISLYLSMFGGFDLESCCNRKIYILLKDKNGVALSNKEIIVVSSNNGKYVLGETRVKVKSDGYGNLPVIVRNPNTQIKLVADGKESNTIIQKSDERQKAVLHDFEISRFSAALGKNDIPQPRPQPTRTPQEVRNEQSNSNVDQKNNSDIQKDVSFNIKIVEGDTGKPISNMGFYLTYKGNIKKHSADSSGVKRNIKAEVGQDIEVSVSGDGRNQKIHHFKVEESLNNQMVTIKLQVHNFQLILKKGDQIVPNTLVSIFYRGRQISKRTNIAGVINLKMLVGFVYGFGVGDKILAKARVINGSPYRVFRINEGFVKESMLIDNRQIKLKQKPIETKISTSNKVEQKKNEVQAETPKVSQQNTHTENGGKPLTKISNQAPATSDTTRYHIYSDGKIKRENSAATGYAEYIYYDKSGKVHNIGKTKFIVAPKRKPGNEVVGGNIYLIDQRTLKSYKSLDGKVGYYWDIYLPGRDRYYLKGDAFAAIIGALCSLGYGYYHGSGFSVRDGRSIGSKSHYNGINGDFRYLGINGCHKNGPVLVSQEGRFDWDANVRFVNALYLFGYKSFGSQVMRRKGQPDKTLPHVVFTNGDHDNHLHLQGYQPNIQEI